MKIKIAIDVETPRWLSRVIAYAAPIVLVLGVGAIVSATPQQWTPQEVLQANDLNKLAVVTNGGVSYSVGATAYCGATTTTFTGNLGGYTGAKQACQGVAAGCLSSSTAHMCTTEEMLRSAQLGVTVAEGWYSGGFFAASGSATYPTPDCVGWTTAQTQSTGPTWNAGSPTNDYCSASHSILCCD